MPTYEYSCRDCGEPLEVVQSIHDDSLTTCPRCGGSLRKLFGNVGVVFKGSGFYKNDSRSGSKGADSSHKEVVRKDASKSQVAKTDGGSSSSGGSAAASSSPKSDVGNKGSSSSSGAKKSASSTD